MRSLIPPAVLALVSFIACGSADTTADPSGPAAASPGSDGGKITAPGPNGGDSGTEKTDGQTANDGSTTPTGTMPTTVFTVIFENHDYKEVVDNADAPYFNSLIAKYGLATNYHDSGVHPSLPNYLVMISGAAQYVGGVDVGPKVPLLFPKKEPHLGAQLQTAGIAWRSYQESMGTACNLSTSSPYAPKHDPFLYFDDIQNGANDLCATLNVDYTQFPTELAAGNIRYSFITPNLTNDGHDATTPSAGMKTSDAWAKVEIEKIIASPAYKNGGVIFITWDEAEGRNGDSTSQIPMIVVSESIKSPGYKSAVKYSHKSYLATVEDIFGLPRLDTVKNEPNMLEFFK